MYILLLFNFKCENSVSSRKTRRSLGGHWEVIGRSLGGHCVEANFTLHIVRDCCASGVRDRQTQTDTDRQTSALCGSGCEILNLRLYMFIVVPSSAVMPLDMNFRIYASIFSAVFCSLLLCFWK